MKLTENFSLAEMVKSETALRRGLDNTPGEEEINNLQLAQIIADVQGKPLNYEMVDFHSSRPGHDLRYALSGEYMRTLGWEPKVSLTERIGQVVEWTLANERWLRI